MFSLITEAIRTAARATTIQPKGIIILTPESKGQSNRTMVTDHPVSKQSIMEIITRMDFNGKTIEFIIKEV